MSSSNCCFLTCIQISQEAGKVVWYSHLLKNFPQCVVIHTVKGFGIVNKAEVEVFLEVSCFFNDPMDVGNLISLNIWKFSIHILLLEYVALYCRVSFYCTIALISHISKVMLKVLQARFQQYMNREIPDVQTGFRKCRGTWDQIVNSHWIIEKAREFYKNIYFCFIDYAKAFD